jgi:hypothetical protein
MGRSCCRRLTLRGSWTPTSSSWAPLKNVSNKIDDNAKGDTPPHITVKPPLGIG